VQASVIATLTPVFAIKVVFSDSRLNDSASTLAG